ncbi:hypothetical protein BDZ94DRAFT_1320258 [Collybia nuda]|uniref:Uncharacterized protein n=1 Tax=Collybia nuda TaxID=64659 RepID=A0A9P5YA12_9AGAR|nr:hypothetical protein BDZ94DRAFT_1320258 [Collybia nuda]
MLGETERLFRLSPSPPLPEDQANKVDQLVAALERCIASNRTCIGEGPWEVEGRWDAETLEGFERSCQQQWGVEHDLDTGIINLWGDSSPLHSSLGDDLRALLFARIDKAVKELPLEDKVTEALVQDVLLSTTVRKYTLKHPDPSSTIKTKQPDAMIAIHPEYAAFPQYSCPQQHQASPGIVVEVAYLNESLAALDSEVRLWAQSIIGTPARLATGVFIQDRPGYPADPYATLALWLPGENKLNLIPFGADSSVGLISGKQVGCSVSPDTLDGHTIPGQPTLSSEQFIVREECPPVPIGSVYLDLSREKFEEKHDVRLSDAEMKALTGLTVVPDLTKLRLAVFKCLYKPSQKSLGKRLSCGYQFQSCC